jgi:TM2 domain-containing membrane protein YozV
VDSDEDDDVPSEALVPPAYKSPGLAAVLSIVPGFGQFYNGQFKKGLAFMFFLLAIGLMAYYGKHSKFKEGFLSPLGLLIIGIVSAILIWLLCIYDAHRTAARKNEMGY